MTLPQRPNKLMLGLHRLLGVCLIFIQPRSYVGCWGRPKTAFPSSGPCVAPRIDQIFYKHDHLMLGAGRVEHTPASASRVATDHATISGLSIVSSALAKLVDD